jgi:hypothetical protein
MKSNPSRREHRGTETRRKTKKEADESKSVFVRIPHHGRLARVLILKQETGEMPVIPEKHE